uniref:2'-5' oligoadenylate synthase n=1 Tax=Castor canadensis TaxID=51338 RepID=A0A8C0WEC4_CASCN
MENWGSQVTSVPADELEFFIQNNLEPYGEFQKKVHTIVSTICDILMNSLTFPVVQGMAMGGSYGRDTVLRGHSDGVLVLFLDHLQQFRDQKKSQQEILNIIEQQLKNYLLIDQVKILRFQECLLISVSWWKQQMIFKVVPAFNPLGVNESPSPWIYRQLKSSLDEARASPGEFSVCFTKLQQKFFGKYPRKVKDLILLLKYWLQQCQEKWGDSSLSSYALELLTVYAWEQGCNAEAFDIAAGVRTVLQLILQQEQLCIYWTVNYNFEVETIRNTLLYQLRSQRPVILDPTDPTNNVSRDHSFWLQLKEEASHWLTSPSLNNELPAPRWNVLPAPLFMTPSHLLDKFIKDFLQPNKDFLGQVRSAVNIICDFLKENCFRYSPTKVQKVVKGGSAAKGTALKNGSDADIIVFLDSLKSYTSQKEQRSQVIQEIQKQLEACQQEKELEVKFEVSKWKAPRVLSFSLKSKTLNESVDFDVLPAFNALGQLTAVSKSQAYAQLIGLYKSSDVLGGEFSTCFTELQRNFVESRPTKLKDLIRLVKHWYKQCERKLKPKASLPPKYALELLTIYAWEQGSGMNNFDTAGGFRTVLELVTKYEQLCIFWTVNYNFEVELMRKFLLTQIQKTRPVILDPADPTGDVGGGDRWCWNLLAKEAKEWFSSSCFINGSGYPVQPWRVPTVQTPGSCGARVYPVVNETFPVSCHSTLIWQY